MTEKTVTLVPGDTLVVRADTLHESPSEREKRIKEEAIRRARSYFQEYSEGIDFLRGGRTEDRESLQMDSGATLRGVAQGLIDAHVGVDDVVIDVRRSLLAQAGRTDPIFLQDIARGFGRLLTDEIERTLEER